MKLSARRVLIAIATFAVVTVLALALGGCFERKLSATQTAEFIRHYTSAESVNCRRGRDGWDYTCTMRFRDQPPATIDVKVNGSEVTDQDAP